MVVEEEAELVLEEQNDLVVVEERELVAQRLDEEVVEAFCWRVIKNWYFDTMSPGHRSK